MRRRKFITLASGAVAAWPLAAFGKTRRIAFVLAAAPVTILTETAGIPLFSALFSELRRLGYFEGQNLLIERYSGEGRASQYPDLARDVVSRNPDVIVSTGSNYLTLDLKAATTTIPIVGIMGNPIENGIVPSLARPGGNITGVTVDVGPEQWAKHSIVAAGGAAGDSIGVAPVARSATAVGSLSRRNCPTDGNCLGWAALRSSCKRN